MNSKTILSKHHYEINHLQDNRVGDTIEINTERDHLVLRITPSGLIRLGETAKSKSYCVACGRRKGQLHESNRIKHVD